MITKHDMKEILGEDFFKEETKCDYVISAQMKQMWAMQLDLYLVFSEICEKYGIKYFMFYGGLLGAIRHDGFIPWDDDIDVAMMREDYDRFLSVAPKELEEPYALQTPFSYPNCLYSVCTLRNSSGTFTPRIFKNLDYNKGIPIDIFPIDYCNPNTINEDRVEIYKNIMQCSVYMKFLCGVQSEKQKKDVDEFGLVENPIDSWKRIHEIASNAKYKESGCCAVTTAVYGNMKKAPKIFPVSCFERSVNHKFENIEIRIPVDYETVLRNLYGDYMALPPMDERGVKNLQLIVEPNIPYKDMNFDVY